MCRFLLDRHNMLKPWLFKVAGVLWPRDRPARPRLRGRRGDRPICPLFGPRRLHDSVLQVRTRLPEAAAQQSVRQSVYDGWRAGGGGLPARHQTRPPVRHVR
jgi:hypothetical protein